MTDQTAQLIEIRDPALDGHAIVRRVRERVAQRRAEGDYNPRLATLGPASLRQDYSLPATDTTSLDMPGLRQAVADLLTQGRLREPDFESGTPLVGKLIVAIRRMWNWMSTKWYVRPILLQQTDVNAQSARVISDLVHWHTLDNHRLAQLEKRVAELEASLARLQARIEP